VNTQIVKLPSGVNPDGLLTLAKAAEISGIPRRTLYHYKDQPCNGLVGYKIGKKVFFRAGEFVRWLNRTAKPQRSYL